MSRAPRGAQVVPVALDAGVLGVVLAAAAGLGRLTTAPGAGRVLAPELLCSAAAFVVAAVVRRRAGRLLAALSGTVVVVFFCLWWFESRHTPWGAPTGAAFRGLAHLLRIAGHVIGSRPTPLPASPGVVAWVSGGAGLVAVASGCLLGRAPRRRSAPDAVPLHSGAVAAGLPPAALFCYTALLSSGSGRVWAVTLMLVALCLLLVAVDRARPRLSVDAAVAARFGAVGDRSVLWGRSVRAKAAVVVPVGVVMGVAVGVPLAVSPSLATTHLHAFPFPEPAGGSVGAGAANGTGASEIGVDTGGRAVPEIAAGQSVVATSDLTDDLGAVITGRLQELMFVADTPLPTYWQVATLTRFDGQRWTADPVTTAVARGQGSPLRSTAPAGALPVLPEPRSHRLFSAFVSIGALRSSLLPVPPGTEAVAGGGAVLVPGVGAVTERASIPDLSYDTQSPVLSTSGVATTVGPGATAAALAPYLALPTLDPAVVRLAHAVVRGARTPRDEALAIGSYFRSGRFQYSLNGAATGGETLTSFLFDVRAGFCQQFAGAYAVLARLDGLPTRLAVGFTAGQREPDGSYLVRGGDAHVWPEVYLGPNQGWTSVEPTPPGGDGQPAAGLLLAPASTRGSGHASSSANPHRGPNSQPAPLPSIPDVSSRGASHLSVRGRRPAPAGSTPTPLWVLAGVVGIGALGVVALRWRHRLGDVISGLRPRSPRAAVVHSWRRATRELGRRHPGRLPAETMPEYVARLRGTSGAARRRVPVPHTVAHAAGRPELAELADLAARACYAADEPTRAEVTRARRLQAEVCAATRARRPTHSTVVGHHQS